LSLNLSFDLSVPLKQRHRQRHVQRAHRTTDGILKIGDRAIASSKSGIHGEIAAGEVVSGYPAIPNRLWLRCSAAFNKLPEMARTLRKLNGANQS
jgi:UDP-3-O-[3-hydroxymyristoyl] glucosamine N-acyltransferase